MKRLMLVVGIVCCGAVSPASTPARDPAAARVTIQRAIALAIAAVGDRSANWDQGCDIRVRTGKTDWSVDFEPIPKRPGGDVMVIVHADGSTTVTPY